MDIKEELKALEDTRKNEEVSAAQSKEYEQRIREKIARGETTGDPIRDFIILKYGRQMEVTVKTLHGLEERLKGKKGQYAATVETTIHVSIGERGIHCPIHKRYVHRLSIGVLDGETLVLSEKRDSWGLPTSQHIAEEYDNAHSGAMILEKNFQLIFDVGADIHQGMLSFHDAPSEHKNYRVVLLIGDDELLRWLADPKDPDDRRPSRWWIDTFGWMAQKLERKLDDFPLFAQTIREKQERLIAELTDLKSQRDQIRNRGENREELLTNAREMKDVITKIQEKLATAAGYGLSDHVLIRELETSYGKPPT